jgi:hypothetical protein
MSGPRDVKLAQEFAKALAWANANPKAVYAAEQESEDWDKSYWDAHPYHPDDDEPDLDEEDGEETGLKQWAKQRR